MAKAIDIESLPTSSDADPAHAGWPEPFRSQLGSFVGRTLGEPFGLTAFGVELETLRPGGQSALRHWHTNSDEFVWIVAGELTLVTNDGEQRLQSGMCVGFKAGVADGHHLVNRSGADATFLVVGSRAAGDRVNYPDDDFQWLEQDGRWIAARKDGTPY